MINQEKQFAYSHLVFRAAIFLLPLIVGCLMLRVFGWPIFGMALLFVGGLNVSMDTAKNESSGSLLSVFGIACASIAIIVLGWFQLSDLANHKLSLLSNVTLEVLCTIAILAAEVVYLSTLSLNQRKGSGLLDEECKAEDR
jgi:hypothetical protein